ncbi:cytochrome c [Neptunomonas sp.]|uniref:c-type cytochrome n=1 Tax=Neptunomonas sp. TaxID=1971898 RepID=UPI0025FAE602|nr:cytochrome c [Neptunomonas sp.]
MSISSNGACFKRLLVMSGAAIGTVAIGGVAFLYSGLYSMGADDPHYDVTTWALETLRENSIARASQSIEVPSDLNSAERLLKGGADYNDMCAGCHLKPGKSENDFTLGLYPAPPNLATIHRTGEDEESEDQRNFWIIKHGIKASGMPAWAPGHDDTRIWSMVAFLKRLPDLTPTQYQILTARGKNDAAHH